MKKFFIFLIRTYQVILSPLFPPACRFTPTCSHYAIDAISLYGPGRGIVMAARRLLKCHPFHKGGHDPVDYNEMSDKVR